MEMLKKCISIFLALQLVGATLVPTYAARDMYSNASIDSVDVSNDDTLSKHNNRIIIKFKDDKSRSKFKKSKGKKIKNKIKKEKDFKVKNKHYSIIDVEESENIDDLIQSISNEYNDEIEMVQPDYIISSFAKNEEIIIEDMDIADENVSVSQSTSATEENGMEDVLVAVIDTAID